MKCPFCGEEMRPGALQTKLIRRDFAGWRFRWVPPLPEQDPPPKPSGTKSVLPEIMRDALNALESLSADHRWDLESALCVEPKEEKRGLEDMLVNNDVFYQDTWYCPHCEKALCVFRRDKERDDWMNQPLWPEEDGEDPKPPDPKPPAAPPPSQGRPKPKDDPWEQKGLFGRRKKPDWEK